jgi:hypothetical protein
MMCAVAGPATEVGESVEYTERCRSPRRERAAEVLDTSLVLVMDGTRLL